MILVASLALCGWAFNVQALIRLIPGAAPLKPMTALCFALAGTALLLLGAASRTVSASLAESRRRMAARSCSLVVLIISVLILVEYITNLNFGFDRLLFPNALSVIEQTHPEPLSWSTNLGFLLLSIALLWQATPAKRYGYLDQFLALALILLCGLVLEGYLFSVEAVHYLAIYSSKAIHTVLLFLLLGVGLLHRRPEVGVMAVISSSATGGVVARRFLPLVIFLPIVAGWLRWQGERLKWYDTSFGVALFATTSILILGMMVWFSAWQLNHTDSARRRAVAALQESENRLFGIINSAMDGIITIDQQQRIRLFNPAAERLFGYSANEVIGQTLDRLLPERFYAAHSEHIRAFGLTSATSRHMGEGGAIYGRRANGKEFPMEASISQVEVGGRKLFTVILRDITERKRTEGELRRYTEDLARSNQDLEQFAYVASHDLQEPLRAVAGSVQLLQRRYEGQLDARADQFIAHAVDGARRMQTLIEDLLTFSRIENRGGQLQSVTSISTLETALANLAVAIKESQAQITHDPLPTVIADPTQLALLFQNLIGNAIKFRREMPRIHISAWRQVDRWVFAVRDNGIGIEAQYFERIFGIFQRLHTRTEYAGTGIGLAICKRIIARHGGELWVESLLGEGATFSFSLPDDPHLHHLQEERPL